MLFRSTLDEVFEDGAEVNEVTLREAKLVKGRWDGVKILGFGEITKKLTVNADRIRANADRKRTLTVPAALRMRGTYAGPRSGHRGTVHQHTPVELG